MSKRNAPLNLTQSPLSSAISAVPSKLVRRPPRPMVLEQRFMFDGAAVGEAVDTLSAPVPDAHALAEAPHAPMLVLETSGNLVPPTWAEAQEQAVAQVQAFLAQTNQHTLFAMFNGGQDSPDARWQAAAEALLSQIRDGDYSLHVQLRSAQELHGAMAAFAAQGPDGQPVIYLNADWARGITDTQALTQVLIEEVGHSLDARLNGGADTQGDEGESFALRVLGMTVDQAQTERLASEQDRDVLQIDGQTVVVENAAVTFAGGYTGTPSAWSEEASSLNGLTVVTGSNFKFTSTNPGDPYFSGNNVAGTLSYVDAGGASRQIGGVISRLFKTGSTVEGFYFYAYGTTLTIGDAATDAAEGAYLLVRQGFTSSFTVGANEGTSSDPVDNALNTVLTSNSAPTALNDLGTVTEDGSLTGNVLTNDSDANLDALTVTQFSVDTNGDGVKETFGISAGGSNTAPITGVGTLQVNSNGVYTFTPASNYSGAVPAVTYTVADGKGGTDTASLSLTITPVNDPPTSTNDTFNVSSNTKTPLTLNDFGTYHDVEGAALSSIEITTLPATGKLEYFNGSSWVAVTAGDRISASAISAGYLRYTGGSDSLTFKVSDGTDWSSSAYTLTIAATVVANQLPDASNDANIVTKSVSLTVTGDVLTNDRDPDGVDSSLTVSRASKGSTLGGTISTIGADTSSTGTEALTYLTLNITQGVGSIKTSDAVSGTGVPAGTTVASRNASAQTVTLSTPALLNVGDTVTIGGTVYTVGAVSAPSSTIIALSGVTGYGISVGTTVSTPTGSGLTITGSTTTVKSVTTVGTYTFVELNSAVSGTPFAGTGNDLLFGTRASATIVGTYGTLTLYQNGSYSYTANAGATDGSVDTFTYEAKDANGGLDTATLTITIRAGNTAPVNALPTSLLVDTGAQLPISTLSVSDTNGDLTSVVLSVTQGTLSANTLGGGSVSGKGTTSLTLSGTQADINAMLATLVYSANTNASGTDTLTVVSTDSGTLKDTDNYTITLRAAPTVTGTVVNEASPYVYFTVSGEINQSVSLALSGAPSDGTATVGSDVLPNLEYYDGSVWRSYTGAVTIPAINGAGKLFVRTAVLQDSVSEGAETLRLTATNVAGVSKTGDATIRDDGAGDIYDGTISAGGSLNTMGGTPDDDRPFGVNNIFVNEGSPFAVFEVTGIAGQTVSLALQEGTAKSSGGDPDFGSSLEYLNTATGQWATYTGAISIPTGGKLLVRTAVVNNNVYEGAENFGLVATNTGGVSTTGTGVILDDGTGAYYPDNTTGATNPTATLDRDTAITVTAQSPVNEASPYAMFTVVATSGLQIGLLLNNGTAELDLSSASIAYSYDGENWTPYTWNGTSGDKPTAPTDISGKGTFYVRVGISSEQDSSTPVYEGPETFELIATTLSSSGSGTVTQSGSAEATIVDDGSGFIDGPKLADHTPTGAESDVPSVSIAVSPSSMLEDAVGNLTYTVTLSHASAFDTVVTYTLGGTATEGTDYGNIATKSLTIAAGSLSGSFSVNPTADATLESDETVIATVTGATTDGKALSVTTSSATGTITNDDTTSDTTPPTATIVVSDAALKAGETTTVTITFSEPVTGFALDDLTTANGTLSELTSSDGGLTWTAKLTPDANVEDPSNVITLDNTGITDAAGNAGTGTTDSSSYAIDTKRPTASIVLADTALKIGDTSLVTITFSEAVTGFTNADLTVANGSLSSVSSSDGGTTWTATFTPSSNIEDATNVITLDNTGVTDLAGNAGSGTTDSSNYAVDTLRPTVVITSDKASLKVGQTATLTFTFSEDVGSSFIDSDITFSGGTLGALTKVSATEYRAVFTPTADSTTMGVVSVDSTKFTDVAGNANTDGSEDNNTATLTVDTLRPTVTPNQVFKYSENSLTTTELGTVLASDGAGTITAYRFANGTTTSPDGYFRIDASTGKLYLTSAGAAAASNDYETTPNQFTLSVQAQDAAGNWSSTIDVTLNVTDVNDHAPAGANDTVSTVEDAVLTGKVPVATDGDGDTLTYAKATDPANGTLTFNADGTYEYTPATDFSGTDSFNYTVSDGRGQSTTYTITITVSPLPRFSIDDITVDEAAGTATLTVTRSGPTTGTSTVTYSTGNDSATGGGSDFTDKTGSLSFGPGETSKTITITIRDDADSEGRETFQVSLSGAGNAKISDAQGQGTIVDDGSLPGGSDDRPLTVSSPIVTESSPYVVFKVDGAPGQQVTLSLSSGTGTVGADTTGPLQYFGGGQWRSYTPGQRVDIPAGGSALLVRVALVNDGDFEGAETLRLTAANTGGTSYAGDATVADDGSTGNRFEADNTTGTASTGTADDDRPQPTPAPSAPIAPAEQPSLVVEPTPADPSGPQPHPTVVRPLGAGASCGRAHRRRADQPIWLPRGRQRSANRQPHRLPRHH